MKGDEIWSIKSLDVHSSHKKSQIYPKKTVRLGESGTCLLLLIIRSWKLLQPLLSRPPREPPECLHFDGHPKKENFHSMIVSEKWKTSDHRMDSGSLCQIFRRVSRDDKRRSRS